MGSARHTGVVLNGPFSSGGAMKAVVRTTFALVIGVLVTIAVIVLMEQFTSWLFPSPLAGDIADPAVASEFMQQLPTMALLLVLLGWLLSITAGVWSASLIAGRSRGRFALTIGCFVLLSCIANFFQLPHPTWFVGVTSLAVPLLAYANWWIARRYFVWKRWSKV